MKELGRGTAYNTHNATSLIRTLKHVSDILQTEEAFTVEQYKHTHTHTHTHTINNLCKTERYIPSNWDIFYSIHVSTLTNYLCMRLFMNNVISSQIKPVI